ncbi:MAG: hypothetical protein U0U46_11485 [Saprospiraceae bacterium]
MEVQDKIKPACLPPANTTVSCENFDPSLWAYGKAAVADNCCLDTMQHIRASAVCNTAPTTRCSTRCRSRARSALTTATASRASAQRVFVNYEQDYFVRFPNDVIVTVCDGTGNYGEPTFFGEDCELLGVSFEDEVFTVVPDGASRSSGRGRSSTGARTTRTPCVYVPN